MIEFFKFLLNISPNFFKKRVLKILKKNDEDSEYVCDIAGVKPRIYKRLDFLPAKKSKFEDTMVNIPCNYDKILMQLYGDYMKLPPKEQRYNHVDANIDFGRYSENKPEN